MPEKGLDEKKAVFYNNEALLSQGGNCAMKMTFQPKKRDRKVHGFRARMASAGGRKVLKARRAKGRKAIA